MVEKVEKVENELGIALKNVKFSEELSDILEKLTKGGYTDADSIRNDTAPEIQRNSGVKSPDAKKIKTAMNKLSMISGGKLDLVTNKNKLTFYLELIDAIRKKTTADICVFCDITGSMSKYHELATQAMEAMKKILFERNNFIARFAFVGYRDYGDARQFEIKDFTTDCNEIFLFMKNVQCSGGGDDCEDVKGGMERVLKALSWKSDFQLVVFICDAPSHGTSYHDKAKWDDHPDEDKKEDNLEYYIQEWAKKFHLLILKANDSVDMMLKFFEKYYNKYRKLNVEKLSSNPTLPQFLYTFKNSVQDSVNFSQSNITISREEVEYCEKGSFVKDNVSIRLLYPKNEELPDFKKSFEIHIILESDGPRDFLMDRYKAESGIFKDTHKAVDQTTQIDYVIKFPKHLINEESIKEELRCYTLAKFISKEFNKALSYIENTELKTKIRLSFLDCMSGVVVNDSKKEHLLDTCPSESLCEELKSTRENEIKEKEEKKSSNFVFIEQFIEGNFLKFNNNYGWTNEKEEEKDIEFRMLAQAFSHFSYEKTRGTFLIVDLQGCVDIENNKLCLTDPAVHSAKFPKGYGPTNFGTVGFAKFFLSHKCNKYCEGLRLFQPHRIFNACVRGDKKEIDEVVEEYSDSRIRESYERSVKIDSE